MESGSSTVFYIIFAAFLVWGVFRPWSRGRLSSILFFLCVFIFYITQIIDLTNDGSDILNSKKLMDSGIVLLLILYVYENLAKNKWKSFFLMKYYSQISGKVDVVDDKESDTVMKVFLILFYILCVVRIIIFGL